MIDPVCGMEVTPEDAAGSYTYQGQEFLFCNESCLERFQADPEAFLGPPAERVSTPPGDPDAIYTCPMDPEVQQRGPGACPQCGMALEPLTVTVDEEANPELQLMARRFWICLALTLPLIALTMSAMLGQEFVRHLVGPGRSPGLNWLWLRQWWPGAGGLSSNAGGPPS